MALIDKETILAEIERRMKIYENPCGAGSLYDIRKKHALAGLLDFLDSLPEQPASGELEEEIVGRWKVLNRAENEIPFDTFNGIARHFYELGLNAKKEE